jgi:DNA-binding CsgD family transcriptional regulator
MLSASHGLTYAEQRVLRALVDNSTVREIAALHGVSVTTVRSQIQAVREKLGARSIDALLLQAAALPPVTARC